MTADPQKPSEPPLTDLIPESVIRRVADERRAESELTLVTRQLSEVPELTRDAGDRADDYVEDLVKRRVGLLERVRPASPAHGPRALPINSLVAELGPFFTPWKVVNLPYFSERIDQTPGVQGTSGAFDTYSLSPGGVEFWGNPQDAGNIEPTVEKWWYHTWSCSYVFPSVPGNGTLYYRFTLETSWEIARAIALSGIVSAVVTVGLTADVQAATPFGDGAKTETALPFWVLLPAGNGFVPINEPLLQFSGSIEVQAGRNAALGLICGIDAGLASGFVEILGGLMRTRLVAPPGPAQTPAILDQIEYRFEPEWWVQAVGQRLEEAATSQSAT